MLNKSFPKKTLVVISTAIFGFQLLWDGYLFILPGHNHFVNYFFNVVYGTTPILVGLLLLAYVFRRQIGGEIASALVYLAIGSLSFGLALYSWAYYNIILHVPVPYPSPTDILFVAYPLFLTIGTVQLLRFYTTLVNFRATIEAIIIFLLTFVPSYYYLNLNFFDQRLSLATKLLLFGILVGTSLLMGVIYLTIRVGGGKLRRYLIFYTLSYIVVIGADLFFQYRNDLGIYWNGDLSDTFFTLHTYLFALATIYTLNTVFGNDALPGYSGNNASNPSDNTSLGKA